MNISASCNLGCSRPASQVPTCGTSDPGVMQMMMLPAAAFGDIMMTNVMNPIMDMFSTGHNKGTERQEESERSSQEESTSKRSWRVSPPQIRRPKSRRDWWRALGQVEKQVGRLKIEVFQVKPTAQAENKKESRGKRAKRSVSFYSYSPWLTNNVNPNNPSTSSTLTRPPKNSSPRFPMFSPPTSTGTTG